MDQSGSSGVSQRTAERASLQPELPRAGRIMIVEDEALIAMVLVDHLQETWPDSAVGPFSRVADAFKVEGEELDAAILDSHDVLGATSVYPVADMLQGARGMPFLFMTGYGSASIDPRFADVPCCKSRSRREALEDMFVSRNAPLKLTRGAEPSSTRRRAV